MEYLLDTSIVRPLFEADGRVVGRLALMREDDRIYTSVITEGELLFGVARLVGRRKQMLLEQITRFLEGLNGVVPVTRAVAVACGEMRRELEVLGRPIPVNDLWIAAIASSGDLTLVAHDKDFGRVERLRLEDWVEP